MPDTFNLLKRAAYIFFVFILMMQSGGILFFYHVKQCLVRVEMTKTISRRETEFERISLSVSDFEKNRIDNHEVLLDGKMYDIKSIHYKGGQVTLLAKHDIEEDNIIQKIKSFISLGHGPKTVPDHFITLYGLIYILPISTHSFLSNERKQTVFLTFDEAIFSIAQEVASPPPDKV